VNKMVPKKVYLDTKDVAELMSSADPGGGWNTDKARYWLTREGAAQKRGGRWYTTQSRLRACFPEVFEAMAY
jgi:hypothetical protein